MNPLFFLLILVLMAFPGLSHGQALTLQTPSPAQLIPPPTVMTDEAPAEDPVRPSGGIPVIGIDAGHGGGEPGATHRNARGEIDLMEKEASLSVALKMAAILEAKGYKVALSRTADKSLNFLQEDLNGDGKVDGDDELMARIDLFHANEVDLLISIHFNGFSSPDVRGTQTFYCPDRPFAEESRRWATLLHNKQVAKLKEMGVDVVDRGVEDDRVLRKPFGHLFLLGPQSPRNPRPSRMPGVLVEGLFVTSDYEAQLLKEEKIRDGLAQAYSAAVEEYFTEKGRIPPAPPPTPTPMPTPTLTPTPTSTPTPAPVKSFVPSPQEIVRGDPQKPLISLTFDAGSGATATPSILDTLRQKGVTSTFFLTGAWTDKYPQMARQIVDDGHELANHSYSHPDFTQVSDAEIADELARTEEAVNKTTGKSTKPWFRPPFGARNRRVLNLVAGLGYQSIYWTLDSGDWQEEATPQRTLSRVLTSASNGAIIVFHADGASTARSLPQIIDGLRARGLEPVTLSRLLAQP